MTKYDNSGSLGRNDRKERPNHADYRGKATVAGVDYWISGWIKDGEYGKWLSLSFKEREPEPAPPKRKAGADLDDDIPF